MDVKSDFKSNSTKTCREYWSVLYYYIGTTQDFEAIFAT